MNREDVERRVKALLAKAEDAAVGEEESSALASKAEFLMRKYSIEKLTADNPFGEIICVSIGYTTELDEPYYLSRAYCSGAASIVRALKSAELLYHMWNHDPTVVLYGEEDDLYMARRLITSVWRQAQMYRRTWVHSDEFRDYRDELKLGGYWTQSWAQNVQKSYVSGFHWGYAEKMADLARQGNLDDSGTGTDLELARLARIQQALPKSRTSHIRVKSSEGYTAGADDGARADHGRDVNTGAHPAIA